MTIKIARRKFVAALSAMAVAWPLAARAQDTSPIPAGMKPNMKDPLQFWEILSAVINDRFLGRVRGQTDAGDNGAN
jgi:hypothetical protein